MPWECKCGAHVAADHLVTCPRCGVAKGQWTLVAEKTRSFVVAAKRFEVLRGFGGSPRPTKAGALPDVLVPTEVALSLPRAELARLAAAGLLPAPAHVLVVRLVPRKHKDLTTTLSIEHEGSEVVEVEVPAPAGARPEDELVDVPLLLVHGAADGPAPEVPGLTLIDVSEEGELGHAPTLEVRALKRPPRRVTLSAGVVPRLLEQDGDPVAFYHVYLAPLEGEAGPFEACFTDGDGRLGAAVGDGWQEGPPTTFPPRAPGEQVRLHWASGPSSDADLAALPARAWSQVTLGDEVRLRPSRLRGPLRVRVLRPGAAGDPEPVAGAAYRLTSDAGKVLEGATDAAGLLAHDDVALGGWRLEVAGGTHAVDAGTGDEPYELLLEEVRVPEAAWAERAAPGEQATGADAAPDDLDEDDDLPGGFTPSPAVQAVLAEYEAERAGHEGVVA